MESIVDNMGDQNDLYFVDHQSYGYPTNHLKFHICILVWHQTLLVYWQNPILLFTHIDLEWPWLIPVPHQYTHTNVDVGYHTFPEEISEKMLCIHGTSLMRNAYNLDIYLHRHWENMNPFLCLHDLFYLSIILSRIRVLHRQCNNKQTKILWNISQRVICSL